MKYLNVIEQCVKLTALATFNSYKNLHDELIKTGQGTIFSSFHPVGVFGDNLQQFDEIIDSIWLSDKYTSRSTIERYCIDAIQAIHIDGETNTKNNADLRDRWEKIIKKEMTSYDVVFPLYGVTIDKITQISLFTAYNADDYKNFVKNKVFAEEFLREPLFENGANYLVLQIKAKDSGRATELARPYFELFEYIAKFWLNNSRNFDIGIFKYKKWKIEKGLAISEGNFSASFNESGSYEDINISALTNSPAMFRIWDITTKYIQGKSTQIENHLINAIRWVGMANNEDSNVTKHLQYVFALEALLSHRKRKEIITPGIAHQLAEFTAFIIGENVNTEIITKKELRKKVFHEVKKIYDTRSQIAHGNDKNVNKHDINRARKIIYSLIFAILQNDSILKFKNMDELDEWIEDLKFSS